MKRLLHILLLLVLGTAGCIFCDTDERVSEPRENIESHPLGPNGERLNRIPGIQRINIPQGMFSEDVIGTIVETVRLYRGHFKTIREWQVVKVDEANNAVLLQMFHGKHGMHVCLRIEDGQLLADIPFSVNLNQNKTKIHRSAIKWANALILIIRKNIEFDWIELSELQKN